MAVSPKWSHFDAPWFLPAGRPEAIERQSRKGQVLKAGPPELWGKEWVRKKEKKKKGWGKCNGLEKFIEFSYSV
jgi:hypothetical protein